MIKQTVLTRVKPEVKAKLKEMASKEDRSLSAFVAKQLESLTGFCGKDKA